MSALTLIMDEIATTLAAELETDGWQVVAWVNRQPTLPSIDIYPAEPFGDDSVDGFGGYEGMLDFTLRARVNGNDWLSERTVLLSVMDDESPLSPRVLLEDDQTLNGLVASVMVSRPRLGFYPSHEGDIPGCEWSVRILNHTT